MIPLSLLCSSMPLGLFPPGGGGPALSGSLGLGGPGGGPPLLQHRKMINAMKISSSWKQVKKENPIIRSTSPPSSAEIIKSWSLDLSICSYDHLSRGCWALAPLYKSLIKFLTTYPRSWIFRKMHFGWLSSAWDLRKICAVWNNWMGLVFLSQINNKKLLSEHWPDKQTLISEQLSHDTFHKIRELLVYLTKLLDT